MQVPNLNSQIDELVNTELDSRQDFHDWRSKPDRELDTIQLDDDPEHVIQIRLIKKIYCKRMLIYLLVSHETCLKLIPTLFAIKSWLILKQNQLPEEIEAQVGKVACSNSGSKTNSPSGIHQRNPLYYLACKCGNGKEKQR